MALVNKHELLPTLELSPLLFRQDLGKPQSKPMVVAATTKALASLRYSALESVGVAKI